MGVRRINCSTIWSQKMKQEGGPAWSTCVALLNSKQCFEVSGSRSRIYAAAAAALFVRNLLKILWDISTPVCSEYTSMYLFRYVMLCRWCHLTQSFSTRYLKIFLFNFCLKTRLKYQWVFHWGEEKINILIFLAKHW